MWLITDGGVVIIKMLRGPWTELDLKMLLSIWWYSMTFLKEKIVFYVFFFFLLIYSRCLLFGLRNKWSLYANVVGHRNAILNFLPSSGKEEEAAAAATACQWSCIMCLWFSHSVVSPPSLESGWEAYCTVCASTQVWLLNKGQRFMAAALADAISITNDNAEGRQKLRLLPGDSRRMLPACLPHAPHCWQRTLKRSVAVGLKPEPLNAIYKNIVKQQWVLW